MSLEKDEKSNIDKKEKDIILMHDLQKRFMQIKRRLNCFTIIKPGAQIEIADIENYYRLYGPTECMPVFVEKKLFESMHDADFLKLFEVIDQDMIFISKYFYYLAPKSQKLMISIIGPVIRWLEVALVHNGKYANMFGVALVACHKICPEGSTPFCGERVPKG